MEHDERMITDEVGPRNPYSVAIKPAWALHSAENVALDLSG